MGPNFQDATVVAPNKVRVTGTFDTHAEVRDEVVVRVLVIPDNTPAALTKPMVGEARLTGPGTVAGSGPAVTTKVPDPTHADEKLTSGTFEATAIVPSDATYTVTREQRVRIIGVVVSIKTPPDATPPDPQDPPGFETFTWCVGRELL